ncbi:MAG: efflux RND transporter periplasmic adaptor subunit [Deltaproteobacteria bacterium]|nr:efflux RND transporter periplasmic adaptor subunit [Deltaproteobacteria bacterium]
MKKMIYIAGLIITLIIGIAASAVYFQFFNYKYKSNNMPPKKMPKKMVMSLKKGIFVSSRQRQLYGITVGTVKYRKISPVIRSIGELKIAEPLIKKISLRYSGYITKLYANKTGMKIYAGDKLFRIYSPSIFNAEKNLFLAYKNYKNAKKSNYEFSIAESKSYYKAAEKRLKLYGGISKKQIKEIKDGIYTKSDIVIYSNLSGILLKKYVYSGQHFTKGQTLFKLAGLNTLWMNVSIYGSDLKFVNKDSNVSVEFSTYQGKIFNGKVSFIYPYLKSHARVTEARIVFNNSKGLLRPGMFGNAKLIMKPIHKLSIKSSSVLWTGTKPVVFIYNGKGYFAPAKKVVLGKRWGNYYPVISGLKAGERIVTSGTFLISSDANLKQSVNSMAGMPGM